ncbi:MAG: hypothetical protein K8L99_05600 [Anaerolineae bacterium]|nr:hypothetical protein [Anaerolineae bacterium]
MEDKFETTTYPVDAEHGSLRLVIVVIFVGLLIVTYVLINALIPNDGLNIIGVLVSFVVTAVLTQQVEKQLRQRWPSGRHIVVKPNKVTVGKGEQVQESIDTEKQVNVLLWRFEIKRRSRVPKGWLMVACALEQDDVYLPVYTFMAPQEYEKIEADRHFTLLTSKKDKDSQGIGKTDLRLAGEQRRLHAAENVRWMSGAEMNNEDFLQYLRQLQEQFPQWMPIVI